MSTRNINYLSSMLIIGALFFTFGFVTWLNSILIPFFKKACELSDQQAYYVATAFFAAYFIMAIPSSYILKYLGTKKGMVVGLGIMSLACFLFIPAANSRSYVGFLSALFLMGTGLTLLQTASNPYVSVIGPIESAANRISIMGICNKLAGIIGSIFIGGILLKNADAIDETLKVTTDLTAKTAILNDLVSRVIVPYSIMGVVFLVISYLIYISSLKDISEQLTEEEDTKLSMSKTSIFQFRHVWFGALAIFMYVAAEVMAGDLIGVYGKKLGFDTDATKYFTSFGLIGLLIGYLLSIVIIPKYIKQEVWLSICSILGIILAIASYFATPYMAIFFLASLGFANAVMWPAIFPLGIKELGRFTNIGSGLLIMGIVGGAVVPPFYGWLYEKANIGLDFRSAFLVLMVACYAYIFWFGKVGHKTEA